jgi:hypothetical protein
MWCQNPYSTFQNWYKTPQKVPCNEEPKIGVVYIPTLGWMVHHKKFWRPYSYLATQILSTTSWKTPCYDEPIFRGSYPPLRVKGKLQWKNNTIFVFVRYELHLNVVYCIVYSTSKSFLFFNPYKIIKKVIVLRLIAFN